MMRALALLPLAGLIAAGCSTATSPKPGVAQYAIWGTVRDSAGAVVVDAEVAASRRVTAAVTELTFTTTDDSGRFAFANVATGGYEIAAFRPGRSGMAGTVVTVPPSHTSLQFALTRPSVVVGTIEGPSLGPARAAGEDISLTCLVSFGAPDPGGRFALPGVPPGTWRLTANRVLGNSVKETTITVPAGADTVRLPPLWLP